MNRLRQQKEDSILRSLIAEANLPAPGGEALDPVAAALRVLVPYVARLRAEVDELREWRKDQERRQRQADRQLGALRLRGGQHG